MIIRSNSKSALEPAQLSPQCGETRTRYRRNARVSWIGDDIEQRLNTLASDRRDDPELGKMSPDYMDHRCLLANEQMPRAMERQTALLLGRLGRDEAHIRPRHRFADCLRIRGIILLPFDVRLHVGWRHQLHRVTERLELP